MPPSTKRDQKRTVEEAVSYAVGHRVRIEILCILNEGTRSPSELAKLIRQPLTTVSHHVKELTKSGCIEVARVEKARNADQHFYRALKLPIVTDEEAKTLPPEVKQQYAAVILQAIVAESLGALWAGKLNSDPRVRMLWKPFNLDAEGREEFADELEESWDRIVEVAARSANRMAKSGEEGVTMVAATLGFERSRTGKSPAWLVSRLAPGKN